MRLTSGKITMQTPSLTLAPSLSIPPSLLIVAAADGKFRLNRIDQAMKRDNRSKMDETASIGGKSSKIQQSVDFYTKGTSHFPLLIALSSHMRRLVHFRSIVHRRRLGNKGRF